MSGTVVKILPMRKVTFDAVASNSTGWEYIQPPIDVSKYREGTLLVRAHQLSVLGATTLTAEVQVVAPTSDDPYRTFNCGSGANAVASAQFTSADNASVTPENGVVKRVALSANFGGAVILAIRGTQPATPTTLNATLSADLILKE